MKVIKKCPFCGSKNCRADTTIDTTIGEKMFVVHCIDCGCGTDTFYGEIDAITCWNRRSCDYDACSNRISNVNFAAVCEELSSLYIAKNTDYGDSFLITRRTIGPVATVTRVFDKIMRLATLSKQEARVKTESIRDTWMDIANYAIMELMTMDAEKAKEQK